MNFHGSASRSICFIATTFLQHLREPGLGDNASAVTLLSPPGALSVHVPYADLASGTRRAINWA